MTRTLTLALFAIGATAALGLTACASSAGEASGEFPSEDIRLVVPWDAGGDGDLTARTLAPLLEDELGVNVIVENRPGANGSIGYQWVLDQPADGYSISMMGPEVSTLQFQDYDISPENYSFVGQGASGPGAIAVPADSPFETLDDLIDAAEEAPGELTYSSPGTGSVWDLATHKVMAATDTEMQGVPFDGSAPSVQAAAAGHVDFAANAIGLIGPQVDGGKMRFLAMLTEDRVDDYPDVPTASELGVDVEHATWIGMMVPKETPAEVTATLSDAMAAAVESDNFVETMTNANLVPLQRSNPEMDEYVREQAAESKPLFESMDLS